MVNWRWFWHLDWKHCLHLAWALKCAKDWIHVFFPWILTLCHNGFYQIFKASGVKSCHVGSLPNNLHRSFDLDMWSNFPKMVPHLSLHAGQFFMCKERLILMTIAKKNSQSVTMIQIGFVGQPCLDLWYVHPILHWWMLISLYVPNGVVMVSSIELQLTHMNLFLSFLCSLFFMEILFQHSWEVHLHWIAKFRIFKYICSCVILLHWKKWMKRGCKIEIA